MELKVQYRVRKGPPPVSIPCQMYIIHTFHPFFREILFNISLAGTAMCSERLSNQNIVRISHLPHARYMLCLPHSPWSEHYKVRDCSLFLAQSECDTEVHSAHGCLFHLSYTPGVREELL
jgi:hypothetical protein